MSRAVVATANIQCLICFRIPIYYLLVFCLSIRVYFSSVICMMNATWQKQILSTATPNDTGSSSSLERLGTNPHRISLNSVNCVLCLGENGCMYNVKCDCSHQPLRSRGFSLAQCLQCLASKTYNKENV